MNNKGSKKDFSTTWQKAKETIKKFFTSSVYNQYPLPVGTKPKGKFKRDKIYQMDVFHFA